MIPVFLRTRAFERKMTGEDAHKENLVYAIFILGKGQLRSYDILHVGGKGTKMVTSNTTATDETSLAYGTELLRNLEKKWLKEGYTVTDPASRQAPSLSELMGNEFDKSDFYDIHSPTTGKTQLMRKITLRKLQP